MLAAVGVCVVFAGFSAVLSQPFNGVHLEPDQSTRVPDGWRQLERVGESESVVLTFALKQQNLDKLEELFWRVSDPGDERYGKYLNLEDITSLVEPSKETVEMVGRWLRGSGVTDCTTVLTRDFVECSMPARKAERLLGGVKFHRYTDGKRTVIRSEVKYLVPRHLKDHLDFVGGVHRFPPGFRLQVKEKIYQPNFHLGVYPSIIRGRYNLSETDVGSDPKNAQAVAQFLEQFYHATDLEEFMRLWGGGFPHLTKTDKVVGPDSGGAGLEASLDVQYIMSSGANISTWFWSTAGRHESQEPFLVWLTGISNMTSVPWVHSVSYGDDEDSLSTDYMQRINTEFMKAGTRGLTILFASGDSGAGCREVSKDTNVFRPSFPASSPYVTTVGGTMFHSPYEVGDEDADYISGGGFSNIFDMPDYQTSAVESYLNKSTKLPPKSYYNATGRAYPDVAALSDNYWVVMDLIPTPFISGTSAATPVFAGILSLINDLRFQQGKPALGFFNPLLYKSGWEYLYDVTVGCNLGCLDDLTNLQGFCPTEGWDPVTGWGTPNFTLMKKLVQTNYKTDVNQN
ncbi:tripeptidyl-peptidase 1-like isoform X1 [Branchiostoma floridae x Branchiostoma japonicum]